MQLVRVASVPPYQRGKAGRRSSAGDRMFQGRASRERPCCGGADRSGVEDFADRQRWEFWTSIRSVIKSARQETTRLPLIVTSSASDASALTPLLSRRRGGRCWGGGGDGVRTPRGPTRLALCRPENHHASGATTKAARRASCVSGLLMGTSQGWRCRGFKTTLTVCALAVHLRCACKHEPASIHPNQRDEMECHACSVRLRHRHGVYWCRRGTNVGDF